MKNCVNDMGNAVSMAYLKYREANQVLCNYLMSYFNEWQVYITEHDVDVFRLNFCSKSNRLNDTSFLVTKEQIENIKCLLEEVIIPVIVREEADSCECSHNC